MTKLTTSSALIALAIAIPIGMAQGQDTSTVRSDTASSQQTARDTAAQDTMQVGASGDTLSEPQNPQGYRGMERPTNVIPDSALEQDQAPGAVEDRVTGTYEDSAWRDTSGAAQNPAGYRGMERPAGLDSAEARQAADTGQKAGETMKAETDKQTVKAKTDKKKADKAKKAEAKKADAKKAAKAKADKKKAAAADDAKAAAVSGDSAMQDSTQWGRQEDRSPEVQNPPGYRGMERPVNVFPADSGKARDTTSGAVEDRVTGTYEDTAWKDTTGAAQNPAGYRGMERPAALDSASNQVDSASNQVDSASNLEGARSPADTAQQRETQRSE